VRGGCQELLVGLSSVGHSMQRGMAAARHSVASSSLCLSAAEDFLHEPHVLLFCVRGHAAGLAAGCGRTTAPTSDGRQGLSMARHKPRAALRA
jgi:hypothetical protein